MNSRRSLPHCSFPRRSARLRPLGRLAAVAIAQGLLLAAAPSAIAAETAGTEPVVIHIDNFTFSPAAVTITPGTAVTWVNGDDIPHTVVAETKAFRSKTLDTEDRYSFTFETPGDYAYFCSLHPHMTGKVVVKGTGG